MEKDDEKPKSGFQQTQRGFAMLTTPKSLCRGCLLLAVLVLLCLMPGSVRANAPSPKSPWRTIILSDTREVESIAVYVDKAEGSFYLLQTFASEHTKKQEIRFQKPDDAKCIYIAVTMKDGTIRTSDPVESVTRRDLKYDVKSNTLNVKADLGLLYVPLFLLEVVVSSAFLLGFTALVEFLVALPFKLKPYKYVILINIVTNVAMNLILPALRTNISIRGYNDLWIVALLEAAVVLVEYLFYVKKYKDYPKGKLLLFSIIANALSWGLYELVLSFVL